MEKGNWFLCAAMVAVCYAFLFANAPGIDARAETSELIEFDSAMESVSDQISSAADLTLTKENRAILAALLSLEITYNKKRRWKH